MENKRTFWLSYDLGIKGNYSSLYRWLDKQNAKECGDCIAYFEFICKTDNPRDEIKKDLIKNIEFHKTDRIYLIWKDETKDSNVGVFIIGNRKTAPWDGYCVTDTEQTIDM